MDEPSLEQIKTQDNLEEDIDFEKGTCICLGRVDAKAPLLKIPAILYSFFQCRFCPVQDAFVTVGLFPI